jgi:hypothetical protein
MFASKPHHLCYMPALQVLGVGGRPHFRLHIQPGSPAKRKNNDAKSTSREGKGLQVFPGTVTDVIAEVGCATTLMSYKYHPHVLMLSTHNAISSCMSLLS